MSGEPRNAVITGANGAIGSSIAHACAAAGYRLHLVCRTTTSLAAIPGAGDAEIYPCDLGSDSDVAQLCQEFSKMRRASLLVHAAGAFEHGAMQETSPERLDELYRVNLRSPYALTRTLLPALRTAGGHVVFLNSSAGAADGRAAIAAYAATKHALRALADAVREEENSAGVRVLSVYPGRTAGTLQARLHVREGRAYDAERLLQPADIARAVLDALAQASTAEVTDLHIRPATTPQP